MGDFGLVIDTFDRPNTTALGPDWTLYTAGLFSGGVLSIVSNAVNTSGSAFGGAYRRGSFGADQFAEATITLGTSLSFGGVLVRASGTGDGYVGSWETSTGGTYNIQKLVAGSASLGVPVTGVGGSGTKHLRLTVVGSLITLYADGVSVMTLTDSALTSGAPGIVGAISGGTTPVIDNFIAGTIVASDDFNRADGGLGSNWTTIGTAPVITSNKSNGVTNAASYRACWNTAVGTGSEGIFAQCDVVLNGSGGTSYTGPLLSASASSKAESYGLTVTNDGTGLYLTRTTGGVDTDIATLPSFSVSNGVVYETLLTWRVDGTISVYIDGALKISVKDTAVVPLYAGIQFYTQSGSLDTIDNFLAGNATPLVVDDNFNRANGAIGSNWTVDQSSVAITSNALTHTGGGTDSFARYTGATFTDDQWAEVTATLGASQSDATIYVRSTSSANGYLFTWGDVSGGIYALYKNGNTFTTLATALTGVGNTGTKTLRIEAIGTSIKCYADGVEVFSVTDSTHTSGSPGIGGWVSGGTTPILDNFAAGSLFVPDVLVPQDYPYLVTSATASGTGAVTPAIAGLYQPGDVLFLHISGAGDASVDTAPPGNNWISIGSVASSTDAASDRVRTSLYYYVVRGSFVPSFVVPDAGDHISATISIWRNVDSVDIIDATPVSTTNNTNGTSHTATGITTVTNNSTVVVFTGHGNDLLGFSGASIPNAVSTEDGYWNETSSGTDGSTVMFWGGMPTAGASGTPAWSTTSSEESATYVVALRPPIIHTDPWVLPESSNTNSASSRSPDVTFTTFVPKENDVLVVFCSTTGVSVTITNPTGWTNVIGSITDVESDSHQACALYHVVTSAEEAALTQSWTLTNLYSAAKAGQAIAVCVRNVDPSTVKDIAASTFSSTNTVTPHVIAAVTPTASNSLVLAGVFKDGTGAYGTAPSGMTFLGALNTQQGSAVLKYDALSTATVAVGPTNITPSAGDEYISIVVALKKAASSNITGTATSSGSGSTGVATGYSRITGTAASTGSGSTAVASGGVPPTTVNGTAISSGGGGPGSATGSVSNSVTTGSATSTGSGSTGVALGTPSNSVITGTATSTGSGSTGSASGTPSNSVTTGTATSTGSGSTGSSVGTPSNSLTTGTGSSTGSGSNGVVSGYSRITGVVTSTGSGSTGAASGAGSASSISGVAASTGSGSTGVVTGIVNSTGTATSTGSGSNGVASGSVSNSVTSGVATSVGGSSTGTATGTGGVPTISGTSTSTGSGSTGSASGTKTNSVTTGTANSTGSGSTGSASGSGSNSVTIGSATSTGSGSTGSASGTKTNSVTTGTSNSTGSGSTGSASGSGSTPSITGTATATGSGSTAAAIGIGSPHIYTGTATSTSSGSNGVASGTKTNSVISGTAISISSGSTGAALGTTESSTTNGLVTSIGSEGSGEATGVITILGVSESTGAPGNGVAFFTTGVVIIGLLTTKELTPARISEEITPIRETKEITPMRSTSEEIHDHS